MVILLLGSGGREHAMAWKMAQSDRLTALYIAPGNCGTALHGINIDIDISDFEQVASVVRQHAIDMVVVGPEGPLVAGIVDYLERLFPGLMVAGPNASAAQLEGSKAFAKDFMQQYGIPTARFAVFNRNELVEAKSYVDVHEMPVVLKADGLAAGKGVVICEDYATAIDELEQMMSGRFGKASDNVVVEQFLDGIEFSVFVATDGTNYSVLPVAKDYKRIGEGDTGPNTGGMGSVSPVSFVDDHLMQLVADEVIGPTLSGLRSRGIVYRGFIFIGLIKVAGKPYVIEYNCRLGDPETQSVLPRMDFDFIDLLVAICQGKVVNGSLPENPGSAVSTVLASAGYPGPVMEGKPISGLDQLGEVLVFHAGTAFSGADIVTAGGRVLVVTGQGPTQAEAEHASRKAAERINFDGKYYRRDIGFDL